MIKKYNTAILYYTPTCYGDHPTTEQLKTVSDGLGVEVTEIPVTSEIEPSSSQSVDTSKMWTLLGLSTDLDAGHHTYGDLEVVVEPLPCEV